MHGLVKLLHIEVTKMKGEAEREQRNTNAHKIWAVAIDKYCRIYYGSYQEKSILKKEVIRSFREKVEHQTWMG